MSYNLTLTSVIMMLLPICFPGTAGAQYHELGYGEPYQLAGKRMVFTTWYWVRPGQFDYVDDEGKSVLAKRAVKSLPGDPHVHWKEIDFPHGIRLVSETAQRGQIQIKAEKPWEADGIEITSLYQLNADAGPAAGKILAWGHCKPGGNCYFESTDGGVTWLRPNLGLVDFQGSKANNLGGDGMFRGFYDAAAPPEERFKQAYNAEWSLEEFEKSGYKNRRPYSRMALEIAPGRVQAVWGFTSPDGLQWTRTKEQLMVECNDGGQYVYFDPKLKKYCMIMRSHMIGPRADGFLPVPKKDPNEMWHKAAIRFGIGRSESDNFREFPLSESILETSNDMSPSDSIQFCMYTTIPGAPDHHLLFPSRWIRAEDSVVIDFYTSYDGRLWTKMGAPVLSTTNWGEPEGGAVWATNPGLVEFANGDWAIPYSGYLLPAKYPRGDMAQRWGIAVWPKGRLIALEAPEEGQFTTMAFVAPGNTLRINAVTRSSGEIRVEAADLHGKTIPGRSFDDAIPIVGDQHRTIVQWKGGDDIGVKPGAPLTLRFRMQRAKIYCLDFDSH